MAWRGRLLRWGDDDVDDASTPSAATALLCLAWSAPHVLYYFVWTRPRQFQKLCRRRRRGYYYRCYDPVDAFALLASLLKAWQATAFAIWYCHCRAADDIDDGSDDEGATTTSTSLLWLPSSLSIRQIVPAIALVAAGQALNIGIYRAIGKIGVYYGCRLGHKVPWYDGFPFSLGWYCPKHPQYVGSAMTVWAVVLLLWTPTLSANLAAFGVFATSCYAFSAYVEDNL